MKICVLLLALVLSACAASGSRVDRSALSTLKPGVTTYGQAVGKLGKPNGVGHREDGSTVIVYSYMSATPFGATSEVVRLVFDRNGVLTAIPSTTDVN